MNSVEFRKRPKEFTCPIVPLCESLPPKKISRVIEGQLMRSGFSVAANYRAACKAQSTKAFSSKLSMAFEEMDESLSTLDVIADLKLIKANKLVLMKMETDELTRKLAASGKTSQTKLKT